MSPQSCRRARVVVIVCDMRAVTSPRPVYYFLIKPPQSDLVKFVAAEFLFPGVTVCIHTQFSQLSFLGQSVMFF